MHSSLTLRPLAALAFLLGLASVGLHAAASLDVGDAYIREVAGGHQWSIGNNELAASIVVTKIGVQIEALGHEGRRNVIVPRFGDVGLTYDGITSIPGDRAYRFESASAAHVDGRAELTLRFTLRDRPLVVERRYAVAPGVPVIEMWTSVTADRDVTVHDAAAFSLEFAAKDLTWQRGIETPDAEGGPFSVQSRRLDDGVAVGFGSETLSSRQAMPWFGLTGNGERVVVGLAWSGTWRADVRGTVTGTLVEVGLSSSDVLVRQGRTVDFPHGLIEVTADSAAEQARGMAAWVSSRRFGRPFPALATYNSWFQFGIQIDDALIRREMDGFAALGGELFELDAGWYPALNAQDRFDFTSGLGSWQLDRARFPGGLGVLSDYAHARGLKFGVWVEPERVDRATVGRSGNAEERFLARQNGRYQTGVDNAQAPWAQICLAEEAGWNWVRDRLFTFLDEARPDYLKIDMNGWATCTRDDHEHGAGGGNFGHVHGLYRLIAALRARYPALLIENVSGGARRLDPELLVRTDASWVDDQTAPSARVRHHQELLSSFVPPAALLSYVMAGPDEPLAGTVDMAWLARSRTLGVLGLAADLRQLPAADADDLAGYIGQYKVLRGLRGSGYATLLTHPVDVGGGGPGWDVVQHTNPASGVAIVSAFRNPAGDRRIRVALTGLRAATTYRYWSFESGTLGRTSGADLMGAGLDLDGSRLTAQVVIVEPQ
jgi:alpha-galactosidase